MIRSRRLRSVTIVSDCTRRRSAVQSARKVHRGPSSVTVVTPAPLLRVQKKRRHLGESLSILIPQVCRELGSESVDRYASARPRLVHLRGTACRSGLLPHHAAHRLLPLLRPLTARPHANGRTLCVRTNTALPQITRSHLARQAYPDAPFHLRNATDLPAISNTFSPVTFPSLSTPNAHPLPRALRVGPWGNSGARHLGGLDGRRRSVQHVARSSGLHVPPPLLRRQ